MIELNIALEKDLVFFDIESTGLNVLKDRILQIALIKYKKDTPVPEELFMLINPGVPISEEAFAVHGISNEMIRNKPTFTQVGQEIYEFVGDADLAGYNSDRFDVPMLMEEFHRIGLEFDLSRRKLIDVQKIFYKMEPRNGDGFVTPAPIKNDLAAIAKFISDESMLDVTQRLKYNAKGEVVFNFGKYAGQLVAQVFQMEPNYYHWIMEKDFSAQVKQIVKKIYDSQKNGK